MKRVHGASARFWSEAFRLEPKLADDMNVQNRYNAACAAALAGSGQGKDDPPLDDAKKAHWRKQAIDWLKADLAARSKILATGPPQAKQLVTQTLQHWKADTDLAGLRDAARAGQALSRRAESLPGALGRGGRSAGEGPEHQYRARPLRNGPAGLPHATTNRARRGFPTPPECPTAGLPHAPIGLGASETCRSSQWRGRETSPQRSPAGALGRGGRAAGEGTGHQCRARPLRNGPAGLPHATTNRARRGSPTPPECSSAGLPLSPTGLATSETCRSSQWRGREIDDPGIAQ